MAQIYGFIVNLKNDSVSNDAINVIDLKIKWFSNKYLVLYFVQLHFKYFKLDLNECKLYRNTIIMH